MSNLKVEKEDLENKLQNLEKLRAVYDEYQKLVRDLIPTAEKTVEYQARELESVNVPYEDVSISIFVFPIFICFILPVDIIVTPNY